MFKILLFYFFYVTNSTLLKYLKKRILTIVLTSDWFHQAKTIATDATLAQNSVLIQPCYLDLWERKIVDKIYKSRFPLCFIKIFFRKYFPYHPVLKIQETRLVSSIKNQDY